MCEHGPATWGGGRSTGAEARGKTPRDANNAAESTRVERTMDATAEGPAAGFAAYDGRARGGASPRKMAIS